MRIISWVGYFILISVAVVMLSSGAKALSLDLLLIGQANDVQVIKQVVADFEAKSVPGWVYQMSHLCISDNYAIAGVHDKYTGAERVLRKDKGIWTIISSGGGGYNENDLMHVGVPNDTAKRLLQEENCVVNNKNQTN